METHGDDEAARPPQRGVEAPFVGGAVAVGERPAEIGEHRDDLLVPEVGMVAGMRARVGRPGAGIRAAPVVRLRHRRRPHPRPVTHRDR
ncbi:hypothetical protein GCM10009546_47300 [Actinomadura livida]|uniref:Uncharacterized protein n=1 Tax=Actinomadura livida TaxID=79909 RepID=A0ABP3PZ78_9ACTN|nr:hypothetical protein GCM10010208_24730 [Actinomadura livida]